MQGRPGDITAHQAVVLAWGGVAHFAMGVRRQQSENPTGPLATAKSEVCS